MKNLLSQQVTGQLPLLRLFAGIATADQSLADRSIAIALEDLISQVSNGSIEPRSDLGNRLFRLTEKALMRLADTEFDRVVWRGLILIQLDQLSLAEAARTLGVRQTTIAHLAERLSE